MTAPSPPALSYEQKQKLFHELMPQMVGAVPLPDPASPRRSVLTFGPATLPPQTSVVCVGSPMVDFIVERFVIAESTLHWEERIAHPSVTPIVIPNPNRQWWQWRTPKVVERERLHTEFTIARRTRQVQRAEFLISALFVGNQHMWPAYNNPISGDLFGPQSKNLVRAMKCRAGTQVSITVQNIGTESIPFAAVLIGETDPGETIGPGDPCFGPI